MKKDSNSVEKESHQVENLYSTRQEIEYCVRRFTDQNGRSVLELLSQLGPCIPDGVMQNSDLANSRF